ncbi:MAG: NAD(P)/FAD-dependent oxidoreductase, partial [Dehalococcoidia bacterium]|nr:NAD(P)/FAD-dependent oxidoreductase [Dehalococcoidia bacterium]
MMDSLSYDVLVIGAGPAGSTAARTAAQEGARTLLVERKAQVGVPEQCAGYVAQAIRWHVALPAECVAQSVSNLRTYLPDGTVHDAEMPGYLLDRAALDRHLALRAVQAGARLLIHTAAQRLENGEVVLQKEGQEIFVNARIIVGADGPQSTTARWLGLAPGPLARAVQYEVALPRRIEAAEVFFRPVFRGGYAWLFPAGETARVGAAFDADHNDEGVEGLRRLLADFQEEGRVLDSTLSYTAGFVPVGGPGPVRRDNVLLVGDAAGHTHSITGAGILNGIIAGEMAGRAAARAALSDNLAALDEYEEEF